MSQPYRLQRWGRCANCAESLAPGDRRYVTRDGRQWCPAEYGCAPPLADRVSETEAYALLVEEEDDKTHA